MEERLLDLFFQYREMAILISLLASVLVAVLGIVPSVFVTAANILFFGFVQGTLISFAGEAIGALVAFLLYRKGFKNISKKHLEKYPKLGKLIQSEGKDAFLLILSLRLLPFVPSGLVTFAGAIGKVSIGLFTVASTVGKVPALLIEAYSVNFVFQMEWQQKLVFSIISLGILAFVLFKNKRKL
ncbi:TVP38/TMEM64 family protein [Bacillus luteolus]|uniref:TVP38/TMEM64 family membrane protein n=2 Tax=Litchfieldia luteola TaxID=682179 RepID=A0ABR9QML8_9BACI|nr:VTT domain-containing protein [Cytobacillus luteolus]MBE4909737.1 TVP38/TMEM64 family protein [Cytobacillus luteolus]